MTHPDFDLDPPPTATSLEEKIVVANRFRFFITVAVLAAAAFLSVLGSLPKFWTIVGISAAFSVPYVLTWIKLERTARLPALRQLLTLADFISITAVVLFSGGLRSPFFFLYSLPFIVHSFQLDLDLIRWNGILASSGFCFILFSARQSHDVWPWPLAVGQTLCLLIIVGIAVLTASRFKKRENSVSKTLLAQRTAVGFLDALNAIPPTEPMAEMQSRVATILGSLLRPLGLHCRFWVLNPSWKTLQGVGEHPALRPGAPGHLPTFACPAFALRRPFRYQQGASDPCVSEQFNYAKHMCLPVMNDQECQGVLFVASYDGARWLPEDLHLFETLAHALGMALHRKRLFERLQEKLGELDFSFEVGATSMATFVGSTQSLDETTINILDGVRSILKADRATLMLWDPGTETLQTQWVRGGDFKIQSPLRLNMGEGMAGWALKTGDPYWAEYAMSDPHYRPSAQSIQSLLCVPVYTMGGQPLGVINAVTARSPRSFSAREINFLKWFGQQAALAIENAQLHHRNRANIDQLKALNQAKSQFLSLVSHDLRGPLTGIRGFCEILKLGTSGALNDSQTELLNQLERQVDLQERMVDDLLDLARMEKGQLSVKFGSTDLAALLREEVEKSQVEAQQRNITLTFEASDRQAPLEIQADGGRLRQVTWNLIHNALKFTPEQGVVRVRLVDDSEEVHLAVEDTGVGLSADAQGRIFEKFFQVSPGGSKGSQGLGLGLAICKEIVLAHHGSIEARSAGVGLGTTIKATLPKRQPTQNATKLAA